jgi:thiol-disulfide isomerase/thioredoxin
MMMKRRPLLVAGALGLLAPAAAAQPAAPVVWPPITLLDGSTVEPAAWAGRPALVVFWATWCPFCKRHNAHVDKLYRASRGQSLRELGVALEKDADAVRRYMAGNGYDFPVTLDGAALQRQMTARRVIPMTCVVDRNSRLLQAVPGEMFEEDVFDLARLAQRGAA